MMPAHERESLTILPRRCLRDRSDTTQTSAGSRRQHRRVRRAQAQRRAIGFPDPFTRDGPGHQEEPERHSVVEHRRPAAARGGRPTR